MFSTDTKTPIKEKEGRGVCVADDQLVQTTAGNIATHAPEDKLTVLRISAGGVWPDIGEESANE